MWNPYFWASTTLPLSSIPQTATQLWQAFPTYQDGSGQNIQVTINGTNYPVGGDNNWVAGLSFSVNYGTSADGYSGAANSGTGPNLGCGPALQAQMLYEDDMENAIATMYPVDRAGTLTNLGMAWGWRTMSPLWATMWGSAKSVTNTPLPLPYNQSTKIMIILTDGQNNYNDWPGDGYAVCNDSNQTVIVNSALHYPAPYSSYGACPNGSTSTPATVVNSSGHNVAVPADGLFGSPLGSSSDTLASSPWAFTPPTTGPMTSGDYNAYGRLGDHSVLLDGAGNHVYNNGTATGLVETKMNSLCQSIKNKGITIYTIILGTDPQVAPGTQAASDFQACATDPNNGFFRANSDTIDGVFQSILTQLSIASVIS